MPIFLGKPQKTRLYVGDPNVPHDVKWRRRSVEELLHRMGSPMLVKHRYNDSDFKDGNNDVTTSPDYDPIYGQARNRDPLSHGVGYVSTEKSDNEWYDENGNIVVSDLSPGDGWCPAPKYRGFGQGYLTYIILPDAAMDYYKASPGGPLIQVQEANAIAPWWPEINDNDLLINVVVGPNGEILETKERYEARQTNPVSMRGLDRRGRREYTENFGNSFVVNQTFQMVLIPRDNELYNVETDR